MMHLEEPAFRTAALRSDERALPAIPRPHDALDGSRDVARVGRERPRRTGTRDGGELAPFELLDQQRQRTIEHGRDVAVRDRVTQEILRPAQLVVHLA
jgi:hypothetical protein